MNQAKSLDDLKLVVKQFCEEREWDQFHGPKDLAIGISTEANELLDLMRFKSDSEIIEKMQDQTQRAEFEHELADVLFFVLRFAQRFEFDLDACLKLKMEVNARKYPVHTAKGSNKKYNEK